MRERWFSGLVLGGGVVLGAICHAGSAIAASIAIAQPSACGDTVELVHGIELSVGSALSEAAPLHFDLSIVREGARVVARLVTESEPATRRARRLEAPDCTTLAEMIGVAVALALGDLEDTQPEGRTPQSSLNGGAEPVARVARTAEAEAELEANASSNPDRPHTGLEPSLSVWLLGDVGSLPVPSLGAALTAELGWAWLDVVAFGSVLFDREVELGSPNAPRAGATLGLVLGGLLACTHSPDAQAQLAARACIGGELGRLTGVGTGISDPKPGGSFWVAPRLDVSGFLAIANTPLRLGVWLTAAAPANRDELVIEAVGRAHRPPAVVGRGAIGAELRFE